MRDDAIPAELNTSPEHASVTPPRTALNAKVLAALADDLAQLRRDLIEQEVRYSEMLEGIDLAHRSSARNLIHYVSLRRHDIRGLQSRLAQAGLSSLGRTESHVLVTIDRLCAMLALARGKEPVDPVEVPPVGFRHGDQLLTANAARLLGRGRPHRRVRIMVTLSAVVATDPAMVRELLLAGMDCARINCAHDDETVWCTLVEQVTRARSESGVDCSILMDLCGPKPRTGHIRGGEELVRLLPGDHFTLVPMQRARRPWPRTVAHAKLRRSVAIFRKSFAMYAAANRSGSMMARLAASLRTHSLKR
jgi:pyruvate kinase